MQLSEDKMDALVNDCLKITEGKKHPFSKDSHVWTDMEAVVNLVLERAQADARPVAWMDDGSTRNGSESTSYRVVTDATKRNMPSPAAQAYTTPLYTHPEASAPELSEREIADTVNKVRDIALQFHATQQLRGRIARVLVPILTRASAAQSPGLSDAIAWVTKRRDDYIEEFGHIDPDTGALEYGTGKHAEAKREYVGELDEIIEGLQSLNRANAATAKE